MKKLLLFSALLFTIFTAAGSAPVFPMLTGAPVVDGKVNDSEYPGAIHRTLKKRNGAAAVNPTEVYFGIHKGTLYVGFICYEKDVKNIVRACRTPEERDNAVWNDDCVEMRFDPWNAAGDENVQRAVIVNSNGIVYDAVGRDVKKDFNVNAQCSIGKDRWYAEFSVPLTELLPYTTNGNELWRIMLSRKNPRIKEVSTFSGSSIRSFAAEENNLVFRSGPLNSQLPFTLIKLAKNRLHFRSEKKDAVFNCKLELFDAQNKVLHTKKIRLNKLRQEGFFSIPGNKEISKIRFTAGKNAVWEWDWVLQARKEIVKFTENPLYKELFTDEPLGLGVNGTPCRPHGLQEDMLAKGLELGIPWEREKALQLYFDNKLIPCGTSRLFSPEWNDFPNTAPKGMKYVAMADFYYPPKGSSVPRPPNQPRTIRLDPYSEQLALENIKNKYMPYAKDIYAIRFGDEVTEWSVEQFIELSRIHKGKGTYPWLDKAHKIIKEKYGYGKFGPPESAADPNAYRWIALRSFVHDEIIRQHKNMKKFLAEKMPGVKLIGDSSMSAQHRVYDYEDFTADVCDIAVIQLYPARNPAISEFSFNPKQMRDLMHIEEVHPCFHVGNYGAKFTPLETLEKISQGFRGGATGMLWYLQDTRGIRENRSPGMEYYGAPERFMTMMAISKELKNMRKLRFPEPDCGVLLSINTARGYIGGNKVRPQKSQMLHSLLELQGGVWHKFFNETSLKRNRVDLSKFKAVFAADAKYCDKQTLQYLYNYVKNGGTLVITDPEAFSFNPAAEPLERHIFPGLANSVLLPKQSAVQCGKITMQLQHTPAWELKPAAGSRVIMTYLDGKPAALSTPCGKGKVVVFGVNFAQKELVSDPVWQQWSRRFFKDLQIKLDQDIWRFRFPTTLIKDPPPLPKDKCLTNNHIYYRNYQAYYDCNYRCHEKASYRCTPAPDAPAEKSAVLLKRGKLTDRRTAYRSGNASGLKKNPINNRIVGWSSAGKITLEFDMVNKVNFKRAEIFYQGVMRDIDIYTSADSKNWNKQCSYAAAPQETIRLGVRQKTLTLPETAKAVRFIKFEFSPARDTKPILPPGDLPKRINIIPPLRSVPFIQANLQIAEIELWGSGKASAGAKTPVKNLK